MVTKSMPALLLVAALSMFQVPLAAAKPPSWDVVKKSASARFKILGAFGGAAVLDRETGLVWERVPRAGTFTFSDANRECQLLTTGGRLGWRMPQTEELLSLLDPGQKNTGPPALPPEHPFVNLVSAPYWVKDRAAPPFNSNGQILGVILHIISISNFDSGSLLRVWCVRGAASGAPTPW